MLTCETLNFSAGRAKSANPAPTNAHFIVGAQKKTVFGPAGWFHAGFATDGKSG
jgi:hypothetical protein